MNFLSQYRTSLESVLHIINFPKNKQDDFITDFIYEALRASSFKMIESSEEKIEDKSKDSNKIFSFVVDSKMKILIENSLEETLANFIKDISGDQIDYNKQELQKVLLQFIQSKVG